MLDGLNPVIIDINDGVHSINDCWVHDEFDENPTRVFLLARFIDLPGYPTPIGVSVNSIKRLMTRIIRNR